MELAVKRIDLVAKLETVAPALAGNDIVQIMTHFWFTGKSLQAWNGHVSISVPLETDFACAVPGDTLLSLVKGTAAKDLEFECTDDELLVRGGKTTKFKLPTLPADMFNFKMPKAEVAPITAKTPAFLKGMSLCMRSVSLDTSDPNYLGITMIPGQDHVAMFASEGTTMSRAEIAFKGKVPFDRVVIPSLFCKELLSLAKSDKVLHLELLKDRCLYVAPNGTRMFGTPVHVDKPKSFAPIFDDFHPAANDKKLVALAGPRLSRILDRACIVAAGEAKVVKTKVWVKDCRANFETESRLGRVNDHMELEKGHADVMIEVSAKAMRAGCEDFDKLLITKRCVVMANGAAHYLIAGRD